MKKIIILVCILCSLYNISRSQPIAYTLWALDLQCGSVSSIVIHRTNPMIMYAGTADGIYLSIDGGTTWLLEGSLNYVINSIALSTAIPPVIYAGTTLYGMFKSSDGGTTWQQINSGLSESSSIVQAVCIKPNDPNTIVVAVFNGSSDAINGIYKSTNGGVNWFVSNTGISANNRNILCLANNILNPNLIYAGTSFSLAHGGPCRVYKSYDFGSTWINSSNGFDTSSVTGVDIISSLCTSTIDTLTVLAGRFWNTSNGGPWLSTNAGALWVRRANGLGGVAPGSKISSALIRTGSNSRFFVGGNPALYQPGGVWWTTNAGLNWTDFNGGPMMTSFSIRTMAFLPTDGDLYVGVSSPSNATGVYQTYFEGIKKIGSTIPKSFSLSQNYPNPFNPTTIIKFDIPLSRGVPEGRGVSVKLIVYDILGREVATLVNDDLQPGSYEVEWNASGYSSGIYFYKLTTDNFSETKRMVLIK